MLFKYIYHHYLRLEMIELVNYLVVALPPKSPVIVFLSFNTWNVAF